MADELYIRLNGDREDLIDEIEERVGARIEKTSKTAAVLQGLKLGLRQLDLIEETEKDIDETIEDLTVGDIKPEPQNWD